MFISSVRYLCGTYILTEDEHFGSFLFEVSFYTIIRTLSKEIFLTIDNIFDRKDITSHATSEYYTMGRSFKLGYKTKL